MGDIDFDELDKAVNSLMNSSDAPTATKKEIASRNAPKAAAAHRQHMPALGRSSISEPSASPTPKAMDVRFTPSKSAVPAPAARRSGRFMDVVDTSSELNPLRKPIVSPTRETPRKVEQSETQSKSSPAELVLAQSVTPSFTSGTEADIQSEAANKAQETESPAEPIQVRQVVKPSFTADPLQLLDEQALPADTEITKQDEGASDDIRPAAVFGSLETPAANEPEVVATASQPSAVSTETLAVSSTLQEAQPDSSDESVNPADSPPEIQEKINSLLADVVTEQNASDSSVEPTAQQESDKVEVHEVETPFLTDTKIEKRPLNANPLVASEPSPSTLESANEQPPKTDVAASEPNLTDDVMPMPTMPHEQPDVSEVPELSSELVALEATGKGAYELDEQPLPIKSSTDGSQKVDRHKKEAPAGPTSIAQQYQTKQSSGDTSHAPIYDASEYTEPVAHPAKKRSGWLWVFVIFLILAIGSGGAVVLYLFGIIP